jgi:hypothetical protein
MPVAGFTCYGDKTEMRPHYGFERSFTIRRQFVCLSLHLFALNNPAVTERIFMKYKIWVFF